MFFLLGLFCILSPAQRFSGSSWPVTYKVNLLARVAGGVSARASFKPAGDGTQKIQMLLYRKPAFFAQPDSLKGKQEDDLASFIKEYAISDSAMKYKSIELVYRDDKDSISCSKLYSVDSIPLPPLLEETHQWRQRLDRLSHIVPFAIRAAMDTTHRYKRRFIGYVLAGHWYEIDKRVYSICLASVIFDYVLCRDERLFYQVLISSRSQNKNPQQTEIIGFSMEDDFLQNVRKYNSMTLSRDFENQ